MGKQKAVFLRGVAGEQYVPPKRYRDLKRRVSKWVGDKMVGDEVGGDET